MAKRPAKKDSPHLHSPTNSESPTDGTHETAEHDERGELIQDQGELTGEEIAAVIPLPSDEAQAADGRPDPQAVGEIREDAVSPSPAQRRWRFKARQLVANKKPQKRWDWSRFKNVREKSPEERLERAIARYRKEKSLNGQKEPLADATATIIPFPSEQAQAADGSTHPSGDP